MSQLLLPEGGNLTASCVVEATFPRPRFLWSGAAGVALVAEEAAVTRAASSHLLTASSSVVVTGSGGTNNTLLTCTVTHHTRWRIRSSVQHNT